MAARSRPAAVEGDELNVVLSGKGRPEPSARRVAPGGHHRFVHEVVAEDGRGTSAPCRHGLPKRGLSRPTFRFAQGVVPGRHGWFVVAAESGHVQVKAGLFGQGQQTGQLSEVARVGFRRAAHEAPELQMHPDHVGPEGLHLAEIARDRFPFLVPVVLEEPHPVVAVVVETPRHEAGARCAKLEASSIRADPDERLRSRRSTVGRTDATGGNRVAGERRSHQDQPHPGHDRAPNARPVHALWTVGPRGCSEGRMRSRVAFRWACTVSTASAVNTARLQGADASGSGAHRLRCRSDHRPARWICVVLPPRLVSAA